MKNKKAQLTIFIIMALIVVVVIAIIFAIYNLGILKLGLLENPEDYISDCAHDALEEIEERVLETNGYPNTNLTNMMIYRGEKVPYLCKVSEFNAPCIIQEPVFDAKIKKEMIEYITPRINECFEELIKDYERAGYEISTNDTEININFESEEIVAIISKDLVLRKEDEIRAYNKFQGKLNSPLYRIIDTIKYIVNFESALCQFSYINWMRANPDIKLTLFRASDQTKIYTIEDRTSEKSMKIAIKTCLIPAGI